MKVVWYESAIDDLENILEYIARKESYGVAKNVVMQIKNKTKELGVFPEKYQKEKNDTDRNIRRAIIFSYKIIYEIYDKKVNILRIFHTSQSPDKLDDL